MGYDAKEMQRVLAEQRAKIAGRPLPAAAAPKPEGVELRREPVMNKLEQRYARRLGLLQTCKPQAVLAFWPHPMSLRLGPRRHYLPDFMVQRPAAASRILMVETKQVWRDGKGHVEDDSREKFKNAVELYPCFDFLMVAWDGQTDRWITLYRSEGAEDL